MGENSRLERAVNPGSRVPRVDADEELKRLKQDAAMLREQTEALRLIVSDLKGAAQPAPIGARPETSAPSSVPSLEQRKDAQQYIISKDADDVSLTKLLPPPSGLLDELDISPKSDAALTAN